MGTHPFCFQEHSFDAFRSGDGEGPNGSANHVPPQDVDAMEGDVDEDEGQDVDENEDEIDGRNVHDESELHNRSQKGEDEFAMEAGGADDGQQVLSEDGGVDSGDVAQSSGFSISGLWRLFNFLWPARLTNNTATLAIAKLTKLSNWKYFHTNFNYIFIKGDVSGKVFFFDKFLGGLQLICLRVMASQSMRNAKIFFWKSK